MAFTQKDRSLRVNTPVGDDKLLITRLSGREALSELFQFQLELIAENATEVAFDKLIGEPIHVELEMPDGKKRHFNGICSRFAQGRRDEVFTHYRLEIVPKFWLLTRRTECRIFQHEDVPAILKKVLTGLDVKWDLNGKYDERDYCVQYRESDFAFACRLMEEEGIYFFFTHSGKDHQLVVADTPQGHVDVPDFTKTIYEEGHGGVRPEMRVTEWEKVQELRSGKVTLWDHCFELPQQNLEAVKTTVESVAVGKVTHKLKVGGNDKLELYDYPGAYAQRYDGMDSGGGEKAGDLQKIFAENVRTAKIRMEQEAAAAIEIRGASNCRQFTAGHKFKLERHFNADGEYVLRDVTHDARQTADYRTGAPGPLEYSNRFACLPMALPYRPPSRMPKAEIRGPQTATVVGPPGEIIFCDKYARIKVQFNWDRQGKKDANSSCWVRVSNNWGGAKWGGMFLPHVGQEVIVEFEEADPDRPLVTGRVYNAETMPPLDLPDGKTQSIIRDHGGNEIKMQGDGGAQQIKMFSPTGNTTFAIGAPGSPGDGIEGVTDLFFKMSVGRDWKELTKGAKYIEVRDKKYEEIFADSTKLIRANQTEMVWGNKDASIKGYKTETIMGYDRKAILGFNFSYIGGTKTEIIVGLDTKTNLVNKNDIIAGLNVKLTKGGLIDCNNARVLIKRPTLFENVFDVIEREKSEEKEVVKFNTKVTGAMKEQIADLVQKIGKLEAKIDGVHKLTAGSIEITSKGAMKLKASNITLDGNVSVTKDLTVDGHGAVSGLWWTG